MKRFKRIDLIDRMPEELWSEVCKILQKTVTKTIPKKKKQKCKKAKWFLRRVYKQPRKERESKDKGERERYTQMNAEFQRTARRDKKVFLNEQCKETRGKP